MKPHFIIKLRRAIQPRPPFWGAIIYNPELSAFAHISKDIDELLNRYGLNTIVTSEYDLSEVNHWTVPELTNGLDRIYRIILKDNLSISDELIARISALPEVEYARPGRIGYAKLPRHHALFQTSRLEKGHELIHLKEAHFFSKGNSEVKIAVLDTGIDILHPEISHAVCEGKDFVNIIDGAAEFIGDYLDFDDEPEDEVGHGTHVAGILVSAGKKMPIGIVPRCKIIPIKVLGAMKDGQDEVVGAGLIDNINTGIKWAVDNGAEIINMSLGIKKEGGGLPHEEVINYALQKGVMVVAASGNDGTQDEYYPGALKGVLAVGAVDENDQIADFSSYGKQVSFVAPGTNIYSSYRNHGYAFASGTSQASPFVTGTIALLKSFARDNGKTLSDQQVKYILKNTSDKPDGRLKNDKWGYGRINLIDAVKLLNFKLNL
jgi:thermitase